ncbi:MAG: DUF423 domain-containing protein, partial [Proteobacteria bacterium]|nr:DUF423 domain-containing protein [Pseudomonadota bacterium]
FGAHGLKNTFDEYSMGVYQTAVEYQFWHSLALLAVGILSRTTNPPLLKYSGCAFSTGIVIFSGSLYLLAFTKIKWLGAITPIGGMSFMVGWVLLGVVSYQMR